MLTGADPDPPGAVAVEVEPGSSARIRELRADGVAVVAVVTQEPGFPGGPCGAGALIGSLTAAVMAGATAVRTLDPGTTRRVVAVLAALAEAGPYPTEDATDATEDDGPGDARMGP